MDPNWAASLREKLDQFYSWPSLYTFKFIVPAERVQEVTTLFPNHEASVKDSKKGKYRSVTLQMMMPSSDEVIRVYNLVAHIEGVIAL